ncbi:hypothetical protein JQ628_29235 [Bradyrhizobium lablabi]|uniref:DNA-methyltransferase n=1 Tax=Bradyrhizobium lablabi TaxID=722472 RepID=UPI001BAE01A7|nr:site-specific DNA-methyltransferase [Bradyrhizobium lablabi]MBR1125639.1 hypothetical protein [Bradyrhizobium lablabi]
MAQTKGAKGGIRQRGDRLESVKTGDLARPVLYRAVTASSSVPAICSWMDQPRSPPLANVRAKSERRTVCGQRESACCRVCYASVKTENANDNCRAESKPIPVAQAMPAVELHPVLHQMVEEYKFAALKAHGYQVVSPRVIAELILLGRRSRPSSVLRDWKRLTLKQRAPRNRTIEIAADEFETYRSRLIMGGDPLLKPVDKTILGDCFEVAKKLERGFADLLVLDPPYNLNKTFGENSFSRRTVDEYTAWLGAALDLLLPTVKQTGTVYICGDWHSSASIFAAAAPRLKIRNRITWEREKGRGAKANWKNSSEDIWFCTVGDTYTFNVEAVKLRRAVIAPYRNGDGSPKDWAETAGGNFRDTHPSNLWSDITIPFWSMPENTDHPTQKSEKLLAKLILASTSPGDLVFDPFLGSGTSSVVARKLGRKYLGIELDERFALLAEKRLSQADQDQTIQGYAEGVFWERNTLSLINGRARRKADAADEEGRLI